MTTRPSPLIAVVVAALALVACGGDDSADEPADTATTDTATTVPVATDTATTDRATTDPATTETGDGPVSTVPAGVPEEYLEAVGPMDVEGADLPVLETDDIDADPAVGTPAPTVVGVDFDGNPVRIDPAQDGPTMVVFLAHWCPHCNAEVPVLNELRDEGRFPEGLNIVAVSTSPDPGRPNFPPAEWFVDMDWSYPVIADGVDLEVNPPWLAAEAYGVSGFPFVVLVDDAGDVAARWSGEQDPDVTIDTIEEQLGL